MCIGKDIRLNKYKLYWTKNNGKKNIIVKSDIMFAASIRNLKQNLDLFNMKPNKIQLIQTNCKVY